MQFIDLSWRRSYALLLAATILSVACADFFFYGHRIGWTAAAFAAIMIFLVSLRSTRFFKSAGGKIIAVAALGLLFALVEQPTWLNVLYAVFCIGALAIVNAFGLPRDFPEWTKRWTRLLATGWMRLFSDNSVVFRCLARYGVSPAIARSILASIIPILLASVFVAIFGWANPIIAEWLSSLGSWIWRIIQLLPDFLNLPRLFFWLAFAIFAWTILRGRGKRWSINAAPPAPPAAANAHVRSTSIITAGLVVRCLILFNLVFLVENVLDLRFLGNKQLLLPTGIEYKEYVRRGAYPLIAAALLAGLFVLLTFRPKSQTEQSRHARILVYAWIAQTIFLTATAAWRLEQYVEMSELTRLRVASVVWFFLVALGLVYIIWRIVSHKTNLWLLNINALTAAVVIYACCFVNFDGMIADFNIRHCREGGGIGSSLDIEYFRDLGPTVLAQFDEIRPRLDLQWRRDEAAKVSQDLHRELVEQQSDWRSWTLRRMRAAQAVEQQDSLVRANQQLAQIPTAAPR